MPLNKVENAQQALPPALPMTFLPWVISKAVLPLSKLVFHNGDDYSPASITAQGHPALEPGYVMRDMRIAVGTRKTVP